MSVEVKVPALLQKLTGGSKSVLIEGNTIEQLLDNLETEYPGLKDRLVGEDGNPRRFINLYLNDEDIRFLEGLKTPVQDGDVISILPAVAGGEIAPLKL